MTKRKVGNETLTATPPDLNTGPDKFSHWYTDEAARVLLLATALQNELLAAKNIVEIAFQQGDENEREAILKGFSLLDRDGLLVGLAQDSCRTNIITMLTVISQNNPYPAQHFSERAFNQLVLKSLFLDLNVEEIIGLRSRLNPSMSRMCYDYMRERLAASRTIPASIWLTINLKWTPGAAVLFSQFIDDKNSQQRFYVAMSLSWQNQLSRLENEIADRISNEIEPISRRYLKKFKRFC